MICGSTKACQEDFSLFKGACIPQSGVTHCDAIFLSFKLSDSVLEVYLFN